MSDDLTNITQIWDVFFFPVLDSVLVYLFLCLLFGRENILRFKEHLFPKPSKKGKHRLKAYQLSPDRLKTLTKKPLSLLIVSLIICFTFYRLISHLSILFPIKIWYKPPVILLHCIDERELADVWSQYPNLTIDLLIDKISLTQGIVTDTIYSQDVEFTSSVDSVVKFCGLTSFFYFIICIRDFSVWAIVAIFSFISYLTASFICAVSFIFRRVPTKKLEWSKRYFSILKIMRSIPGEIRKIRKNSFALMRKAALKGVKNLFFAMRACVLFALCIFIFVILEFYTFQQYKGILTSQFYRELLIESEEHNPSDKTIEHFLQKIEVLQEENYGQLGLGFDFFIWSIDVPRISESSGFYKLPPIIRDFISRLEDNYSFRMS